MSVNEVVLVDLSSLAYPIWHVSQSDPDPNKPSQAIVARVRSLANGHPSVAICCDAGRSFRKDIAATYKGNRPPSEAALHHQIDLAKEQLRADGFPVWSAPTFEADDLIASAVAHITGPDSPKELTVLIVSADKDLLQLVGPRVRMQRAADGLILDAEGVGAKFGVRPDQMRDFLSLVGDTSDNIAGAKGIGPKNAAELLAKFQTLDNLYQELGDVGGAALGVKPAISASLRVFKPELETTRSLITLRTDVPLPLDELAGTRVAKEAEFVVEDRDEPQPEASAAPVVTAAQASPAGEPATAIAVRESDAIAPAPVEWEMQLEPRSMRDARALATDMFSSRLFSAYGTAAAILSTLMAGREVGMQAMASLRAFHIIEGRPTLAADVIRALVIQSGKAKYFRCTERMATKATFETQRGDDPPMTLTYTIDEGKAAFPGDDKAWAKSGWGRNPADLCVARAGSKLARLVYPDVIHGLYAREEIE